MLKAKFFLSSTKDLVSIYKDLVKDLLLYNIMTCLTCPKGKIGNLSPTVSNLRQSTTNRHFAFPELSIIFGTIRSGLLQGELLS